MWVLLLLLLPAYAADTAAATTGVDIAAVAASDGVVVGVAAAWRSENAVFVVAAFVRGRFAFWGGASYSSAVAFHKLKL